MSRSVDRSQDPSPFAWLMAGAVAAAGLGGLLAAARRRRLAEQDLWAQAEDSGLRPAPRPAGADTDEASVAGHPS